MAKYVNTPDYRHGSQAVTGVLLTNLGTPDAPTASALRRYLGQFLADPRVVEVPRLLWMIILHGVILNIRPRRSAHAYQQVWTDEGSPLLSFSRKQAAAIEQALENSNYGPIKVTAAHPSKAPLPGCIRPMHGDYWYYRFIRNTQPAPVPLPSMR